MVASSEVARAGERRLAMVIPVLDEGPLVPALLAQVGELARDAEVVVVDGGSQDGTREALGARAEALGFRVIDAPRGRGPQMNAGAAATGGEAILFLHADSRLPDDAIARVLDSIDAGAVGGCFRVRIASRDPRLRLAAGLINLRSRLLPSASGDQAIFVRRADFYAVGGFADGLCEDLGLVARLRARGRLALLDRAVETSPRRWERHGVTRTIVLMWALRAAFHLGVDPRTLARFYPDAR
jgi:rSAM/selenodomain-associated transferase 2